MQNIEVTETTTNMRWTSKECIRINENFKWNICRFLMSILFAKVKHWYLNPIVFVYFNNNLIKRIVCINTLLVKLESVIYDCAKFSNNFWTTEVIITVDPLLTIMHISLIERTINNNTWKIYILRDYKLGILPLTTVSELKYQQGKGDRTYNEHYINNELF